jgi:hypothetical protein
MQTRIETVSYVAGRNAYFQGFELCDNPFMVNSDHWYKWVDGWKDAFNEDFLNESDTVNEDSP